MKRSAFLIVVLSTLVVTSSVSRALSEEGKTELGKKEETSTTKTSAKNGKVTHCKIGGEETAYAIGFPAYSDNPDCSWFIVNGATVPIGDAYCLRPCVDIPDDVQIKSATIISRPDLAGYEMWYGPETYPKPGTQTVCLNYKGWSHDTERKIRIKVCW